MLCRQARGKGQNLNELIRLNYSALIQAQLGIDPHEGGI
jgi:hypothetical protein